MNNHTNLCLVAVNVRSTHNVGAFLRTADALGASVWLCGVTPYPKRAVNEKRLPHIADKLNQQIHKTALGAELTVHWEYHEDVKQALTTLRNSGYRLVALEQHEQSSPLHTYHCNMPVALIVGEEVNGLSAEILSLCDDIVEIPMQGNKESLNVSVAAGMALYQLRYHATVKNYDTI